MTIELETSGWIYAVLPSHPIERANICADSAVSDSKKLVLLPSGAVPAGHPPLAMEKYTSEETL